MPAERLADLELLLTGSDPGAAVRAAMSLTTAHPDFAPGWAAACRALLRAGDVAAALRCMDEAVSALPGEARIRLMRARVLWLAGRRDAAIEAGLALGAALDADAAGLDDLGQFLLSAGRYAESLAAYTRAVELAPGEARHRFNRAALLRMVGQLNAAEDEYDRVIALEPREYEAYFNRSDLRPQTTTRHHVDELSRLIASGIPHPRGEVFVRYALAKELEDLGRHAESFVELRLAASVRRAHLRYDVAEDVATVDWIRRWFPAERFLTAPAGGRAAQPIFIVGLPRSGTTLLERVLGGHPDVMAAGELPDFAQALDAAIRGAADDALSRGSRADRIACAASIDFGALGRDYIARVRPLVGSTPHFIDKMPLNYLYCGLIALALPGARILHLTRHPMAVCYAMYKTLFRDAYPFSYDLVEIARYYAAYRRLMDHWHAVLPGRIIDVGYEQLVLDLPGQCARALAACDLPPHPACLAFASNPHPVSTASASQVRRPLYASSVEQWRHYGVELRVLRAALLREGIAAAELD
jgi:tetratricopeptide (TPR) repeat protein